MWPSSKPIPAVAVILMLAGCAPSDTNRPADTASAKRTFSAEERRIAEALSVGGAEVRETTSPRSYAMLCAMALDALGERLDKGDLLTMQQRDALTTAQRLYNSRASSGLYREEQDALRREVEAMHPDTGDRARLGIGCMRSLAET